MEHPTASIIVAIGKDKGKDKNHNHIIGKDNQLLWHISDDLKRFKKLTLGHPIIMGRKTFDSIGRPLPERLNIVVTHNHKWKRDGVVTVHSLKEAFDVARNADTEEFFVIGGAEIYKQALGEIDRLYLTYIKDEKDGDSLFPPFEHLFTRKIYEEKRIDIKTGLSYKWVTLERENPI